MSHVFISYKREDIDRVGPLVDALRAAGLDVWWDQDIPPGGSWRETIVEKLDGSALCVAIWSEHSVGTAGRFVREEAERSARRSAYLGVLIDPVPPPFGFSEWQAIDLAGWDGKADDPQLNYLVDTVKATLAGEAAPVPERPAPRKKAAAKSRLPLLIGGGVALAAAAVALIWLAPWRGAPAQTPTAFVTERLAQSDCTWAGIGETTAMADGEHLRLKGLAAAPEAMQASLLREASAANVPLAGIEVRELAAAPPEVCAELQTMKPYRAPQNEHRLTIVPPRDAPRQMDGALIGFFEWELDWAGLPPHAALLGLDNQSGLKVLIPDLHAYRRATPPERQRGDITTYLAGFDDEGRGVRNVGLVLMTARQPIDAQLVEAIGTEGTAAFLQRIDEAARAGGWTFELGLVRCGFEGGENRPC